MVDTARSVFESRVRRSRLTQEALGRYGVDSDDFVQEVLLAWLPNQHLFDSLRGNWEIFSYLLSLRVWRTLVGKAFAGKRRPPKLYSLEAVRSLNRTGDSSDIEPEAPSIQGPEAQACANELRGLATGLSTRHEEVLMARSSGESWDDIAGAWGCSRQAAQQMYSRAVHNLQTLVA